MEEKSEVLIEDDFDATKDLVELVNLKFDQEKEERRKKRNKRKARLRKEKK